MSDPSQDTVEFTHSDAFADRFFAPVASRVSIDFGGATHRGNVRSNNEDHFAVVRRQRSSEVLLSNLDSEAMGFVDVVAYGLVVADGIGGARFGEFASRLAVQSMLDLSVQATSWIMKLIDMDAQQVRERVQAYVDRIQETLQEYSQADPKLAGMGTTWTSAHLMPPHAVIVHIGDSRAYRFHAGKLEQITRDETMAQAFIDTGMDPDSVSKFSHVLLNCFGADNESVVAQIRKVSFEPGDWLLLCTDGLTDMVPEDEIAHEFQLQTSPQTKCDSLIKRALANGGKDNVTVVIASAGTASQAVPD